MTVAAGENVLVVVLDQHPDPDAVRAAVAGPDRIRVRLVAPAHVGPLHWATTDEGHARTAPRPRRRPEPREATLTGAQCPGGRALAGEADPVLAVQDALSEFAADRIVVLGEEDAALDASLRRFAIPVERLSEPTPGADGRSSAVRL